MLSTLLLAALAPQGPGSVVINEFVYDNSGADDFEFVELVNTTNAPIDITGWGLDHEHDGVPTGVPPTGAFDIQIATMPPSQIVLMPGDHFLIGSLISLQSLDPLVTSVDLEVANPGGQGRWFDSHGVIALRNATGTVIDSVAYEVNKRGGQGQVDPAQSLIEGAGIWGNQLSRNTSTNFRSWSRIEDGYDTDDNGRDFRMSVATPGRTNDQPKPATGSFFFPDPIAAVGSTVPEWPAYFTDTTVINPSVADSNLPAPIAEPNPSGLPTCMTINDIPGGESASLLAAPSSDWLLEANVVIDVRNKDPLGSSTPLEYENWSICLQGFADWFHNSPDPGNAQGFTANGNTGVSVVFTNNEGLATLWVIDHNDGGWSFDNTYPPPNPEVILGSINMNAHLAAMAPPNPLPLNYDPEIRWVRLRIHVTRTTVEVHVGGVYGTCNTMAGVDPTQHVIAGPITMGTPGGIGIGYREEVTADSAGRIGVASDCTPLIFDALVIEYGTDGSGTLLNAGTCLTGVAAAGTNGPAGISVDRMPYLDGCQATEILFTNLPTAPGSATTMSFGFAIWNGGAGFDLQPFGGPPDLSLDVMEAAALPVTVDAMGNGSVGITFLSPDPIFLGRSAYAQAFSLDPGLVGTYTIPVTDTEVIEFKLQRF